MALKQYYKLIDKKMCSEMEPGDRQTYYMRSFARPQQVPSSWTKADFLFSDFPGLVLIEAEYKNSG